VSSTVFFGITPEIMSSEDEHSSRQLRTYSQCFPFPLSRRSSANSFENIFNSALIKSHQSSKSTPPFDWIVWHGVDTDNQKEMISSSEESFCAAAK
jgi:hypothetical protein